MEGTPKWFIYCFRSQRWASLGTTFCCFISGAIVTDILCVHLLIINQDAYNYKAMIQFLEIFREWFIYSIYIFYLFCFKALFQHSGQNTRAQSM